MRSTMRSRMPSAPRRARLSAGAGLTALALAALAGCTGTGSTDGREADGKSSPSDGSSVSAAPPGKYRTLPQPCTAIDADSLHKLVPGAQDYAGTEALTYDTDRLVGCSWRGADTDGTSHTLVISVTRVVSYDPAVSDEAQAQADFERSATAASIPAAPPSGSATATPPAGGGTQDAGNPGSSAGTTATPGTGSTDDANSGGSAGSAGGSPDSAGTDLAPRRIGGVGNAAFINDVAKSPKSGPTRTVTLVFRTANVLATITYTQSAPHGGASPSSADLQKDAEKVATELQHKVEG